MVSLAKLDDEGKLDAYRAELEQRLGITPEEGARIDAFNAGWFAARAAYAPA